MLLRQLSTVHAAVPAEYLCSHGAVHGAVLMDWGFSSKAVLQQDAPQPDVCKAGVAAQHPMQHQAR